ncbi:MAG TPA: hypothetical protein VHU92_02855 [Streptosporangiaceae bacterium]|nr:hypothetical protein [Streptosporangiaceae bacterium]
MTSASDRTDDPIIVSSDDEDGEVTGPQVIHATIVHDDQQDEDEAAQQDETAGPGGQPAPGDQTASSDLPRRAWIPERPMPGSRLAGQPNVAQSVPAQRAPFEPDSAELDSDEPESDEPGSDEPVTEAPAFPGPGQPVVDQPTSSLDADADADADEDEDGQPEAARLDTEQPGLVQPGLVEPGPAGPAPAQPSGDNPWPEIQSMFVDDPRRAVEQSAKVVSTALADLITAAKAIERTLGDDFRREGAGTEELRVALRGYRDLGARIATLTRDFQRS